MSAEEGSAQPPTAGNDKAQAPKPAATFSSFINKNTTGKKFAPKAARRRPGAAPAATAPKPTAPEPTAPTAEAQTAQTEPESSIAPDEPTAAAQLPTPATTQEPGVHNVQDPPKTTSSASEVSLPATVPSTIQEPVSSERVPTPTPTSTEAQVGSGPSHGTPLTQTTQVGQDERDTGRAAKRRRIDPPAQSSTETTNTIADSSATETPTHSAQPEAEASTETQQENLAIGEEEQAVTATENTQLVETDAAQPVTEETDVPRPRKRRVLPWVAVNRPQEVEEEEAVPAPAKRTRKPPKPRGKKKATAPEETQETEQQEGAEGSEAQPVQKRPSAKARGKRRADAADLEDGAEASAPAKRTRRPRKAKDKERAGNAEPGEGEAEEPTEEGEELVVRRKPRQPRRKKRVAPEGEAENNQDGSQPKRKGRPPREPTPSDAEDNEIDPEATFMDSLASRNIRVGKLSDREKAMRDIDWVAVKQRQREEDSRPIQTKDAREKAEQLLAEAAPQIEGPRFRVVDGNIQFLHDSTTVNREAEADREIENYEVVEERDLTSRITSRSFLKNNKRFPNDFLLPGQGKRWTVDDTNLFYQGLRNFGTDFQMISHMFPNFSRRSIKLKFTREERDNPELVRKCLLGQSQMVSHWDTFITASQMNEERFADADEIKREMAEEEAKMRERIAAATAETEERKRQQKEAGLLDDDGEGNEASNKENGKGKKKRKGKDKQVTFQEEAGVEVVGNIDDDATWGQE